MFLDCERSETGHCVRSAMFHAINSGEANLCAPFKTKNADCNNIALLKRSAELWNSREL